jgi:hypothetical protein
MQIVAKLGYEETKKKEMLKLMMYFLKIMFVVYYSGRMSPSSDDEQWG